MSSKDAPDSDEIEKRRLRIEIAIGERAQRLTDWDTNDAKSARSLAIALALLSVIIAAVEAKWLTFPQAAPGLFVLAIAIAASTIAQWPATVPLFRPRELDEAGSEKTAQGLSEYTLVQVGKQHAKLDEINGKKTRWHKVTLAGNLLGAGVTVILKVVELSVYG